MIKKIWNIITHLKYKIYISGKMTGLKDYGKLNFENAESYLKSLGYTRIVNPYKLSYQLTKGKFNKTYDEYIENDLKVLRTCNQLYLLKNWHDSNGCKKELYEAQLNGIEVINE